MKRESWAFSGKNVLFRKFISGTSCLLLSPACSSWQAKILLCQVDAIIVFLCYVPPSLFTGRVHIMMKARLINIVIISYHDHSTENLSRSRKHCQIRMFSSHNGAYVSVVSRDHEQEGSISPKLLLHFFNQQMYFLKLRRMKPWHYYYFWTTEAVVWVCMRITNIGIRNFENQNRLNNILVWYSHDTTSQKWNHINHNSH